jgi:peptide subunit release factor 1 (eRF1)/transcriptional regulator with XRE-family HTH domain
MKEEAKLKLKKLLAQLEKIRGRHTELVTVYIPSGYNLAKVVTQISQEQSTASNIKSKAVRKNVTSALEKILQHLKLYKATPPNGLVIFCGNVSEKEGVSDIQLFALEPPEPVKTKIYQCGQEFILDALKDLIREKEIYGLIVLDKSEANIGLIKGKKIENLKHMTSIVPGKSKKGGQCLAEDSLVQLATGEIVKIKDVHNPYRVKAVDFNNLSIRDSKITGFWKVKKKKSYRIVTKSPRVEIVSSADHIFFVLGNGIIEKCAEDLRTGEHLLMPERLPCEGGVAPLEPLKYYASFMPTRTGRRLLKMRRVKKGLLQRNLAEKLGLTQTAVSVIELGKRCVSRDVLKRLCRALDIDFEAFVQNNCKPARPGLPDKLDENLAQILGYFVGDGSYDVNKLTFHDADRQLLENYRSRIWKVCPKSSIRFRRGRNYFLLRVYSKELVEMLKGEFPEIRDSRTSLIPSKVLISRRSVLGAFLRGFFDAEGYVSSGRIALGISNKLLVQQIQLCLLRFGILSALLEYDSNRNPYSKQHRFTVEVTDKESLKRFSKFIGFDSKPKMQKLRKLVEEKSETGHVREIAVSGKHVREIIERYGLNVNKFPKVSNFFNNGRQMSKHIFKKSILAEIGEKKALHRKLRKISTYDLVPVKIKKIEVIEKQAPMIDISVEGENFIANSLVVHNSADRFARVREGLLFDFLKKIGEVASQQFRNIKDLKGIIIGGPGPLKERMVDEDFLQTDIKSKIIGVVDTSYTGEYGLAETMERAEDIISQASIIREKKLLDRFFDELSKDSGLAVYGIRDVLKALKSGMVETLLLSEEFDFVRAKLECDCGYRGEKLMKSSQKAVCPNCRKELKATKVDIVEEIVKLAEQTGAVVEFISTGTTRGVQLKELGGIGGILRFRSE